MKRACKVSLKFVTDKKQSRIVALLQSYRYAVNEYIKIFWNSKHTRDSVALALLGGSRLSERYKQAALKQAWDMVIATKKSAKAMGKHCVMPCFNGKAVLDSRFITIENGKHAFDLIVKLSTLKTGNRMVVPTKHTAMTRKWLSKPGAKFIQGCALSDNSLTLWVGVLAQSEKQDGRVLGVDMGVNKLMADSDGNFYGKDFKAISNKIRRKKPKSKAKQRAIKERDNFIGRSVNQLPWSKLKAIGVEELTGIKTGKKQNRGKSFRKAMAPWIVRQVVNRISNKASENRVRLVKVNPTNTSRTCPIYGGVSKENRKGEMFQCVACGYKGDADYIGALNVLAKTFVTLGRLQSPRLKQKVA